MLLIDRKMPKTCIDCICNDDNYRCNMTGDELDYDIAWTGRMPNCPLREEERKKGKWIFIREEEGGNALYSCSVCGKGEVHVPIVQVSYCWNCGAGMREET